MSDPDTDETCDGPLFVVLADGRDQEDYDVLFPALRDRGVNAMRCDPRDITTEIEAGRIRFSVRGRLLAPALVLGWVLDEVLDPGMVTLELFAEAGIPIINDAMTLFRAQNKILDSARLATFGVSEYSVISGHDPSELDDWMQQRGRRRVVVKPLRGYGGRGVQRVDDEQDLRHWQKSQRTEREPFYAMPWIENPGRDIRVYTVNHRPVFAMYRYAPDDSFVTNVRAGGSIAMCPLTADLIAVASRASRGAGTLIGGVDIGEDTVTGDLVVYEVNSCPSLEPAVLGEVASFLAAATRNLPVALENWTPSHVYTQRDSDPDLFHASKQDLLRPGG